MNRRRASVARPAAGLVLVLGLLLFVGGRHAAATDRLGRDDATRLFAAARAVPASASLYLHIEDAMAIRERHGGRPLASWCLQLVGESTATDAWARLAARAGASSEELFAAAFGGRVTLIGRHPDGGGFEWALLLDGDPVSLRHLLGRFRPERLWPGDLGVEAWRIPEAGIRVHLLPRVLVVSPAASQDFAEDIVRGLIASGGQVPRETGAGAAGTGGGGGDAARLWAHPGIQAAAGLGNGSVALWTRTGADDWSAMVIDPLTDEADRIRVIATASFASAPFDRPRTDVQWSGGVVDALAESAMAVLAEPMDIGWGRSGAWLARGLGQPLVSDRLQRHLAERRVFVLGEIEGRRLDPPVDAPLPAIAMALEVRPAFAVASELDVHMSSLLRGIARMGGLGGGGDGLNPGLTPSRTLAIDGRGFADLGPAIDRWWRGAGIATDLAPVTAPATALAAAPAAADDGPPAPLAAADLCWGLASGGSGHWIVLASHPAHLEDVTRALAAARPTPEPAAAWTARGVLDGVRLGVHLRDLSEAAGLLAAGDDPAARATIGATLSAASDFVAAFDRCRWSLQRPDDRTVRLELDLQLAEPPTSTASRGGG